MKAQTSILSAVAAVLILAAGMAPAAFAAEEPPAPGPVQAAEEPPAPGPAEGAEPPAPPEAAPAEPPPPAEEPPREEDARAERHFRRVVEFWTPIRPFAVERLRGLRDTDRGEFDDLLEHLDDRRRELIELGKDDPAARDRETQGENLEDRLEAAAARVRHAAADEERGAAERELRALARETVERRLQRLGERLREQEEEMALLRYKVDAMKQHPELFVEDRVSRVLGHGGLFDEDD